MKQKQLMKRTVSALLMLLLLTLRVSAQESVNVKGTVVDESGEPVIGASVVLKGKGGTGTITDFDGNFSFTVPDKNSVIVISYVGMLTQEVKASEKNIKITVEEDLDLMEAILISGKGKWREDNHI